MKSPAVILFNADGVAMAVSEGVAVPLGTSALLIAGSDGTNARRIKTATDGTVRIDPTGTTAQPVSGTFWQATQPVSAASLPLPTGAATSALQTQPGVDIGDVTVNNAAGASAVNVQDGGNSLTVDGTVTANAGTGPWPVTDNGGSLTVDATSWPLPTGAATAALQTQPGVDIGDVTINNAAGAAAVNVQDGGNSLTVDTPQLPAALVGGRLDENIGAWLGSTAPTVGQKVMAASVPVVMPSDQVITIQFGTPGGGTALPKLINVNFNKTEGAVVANVYKRVASYTVPAPYSGYLIKFISFQAESAASRVVAETNMGTHNNSTNVFTAGTMYVSPQWVAIVQAEVTTAFASGSGSVVLTVGYTNQSGTAGRTGTITIPKGSALLSRWDLVLQTGDLGVQSVQSVSGTPTQIGIVKILGLLQLAVHQDQSTTTQTETLFAPGAITFPEGTVIGIEYSGGTVAKARLLDILIQLVQ